jgi:large subunit ribosomal protein L17
MRHRKNTVKLGRPAASRKALLSSLVCNFIEEQRIRTTLPKARLTRILAEKMVTLGKLGTLPARRRAVAVLRQHTPVKKLFESIAPQYKDRQGGYTRIVRLGRRGSDGSEMVLLEWVNLAPIDKRRKTNKADVAQAEPDQDAEKKSGE